VCISTSSLLRCAIICPNVVAISMSDGQAELQLSDRLCDEIRSEACCD